jgi:hypothetical protein
MQICNLILDVFIQSVTERCGQNFGHNFHTPKQEKYPYQLVSGNFCVL